MTDTFREPSGEELVFGLLSEKQQRERLYAQCMDNQRQINTLREMLTESGIREIIKSAFAAENAELSKLLDEVVRMMNHAVAEGLMDRQRLDDAINPKVSA